MAKVKRYLGIVPARRRAMALILFGVVYLTYGVGLMLSPAPHSVGPWWWPGVLFAGGGLLTLYSAVRDRPHNEWIGFTTLQVVSVVWAVNWLMLLVHDAGVRPWSGLLIWSFVTLIVTLLAGWTEPPPKHVMEAVTAYLAQNEVERDGRNDGTDGRRGP
jgi:hypothetical protein